MTFLGEYFRGNILSNLLPLGRVTGHHARNDNHAIQLRGLQCALPLNQVEAGPETLDRELNCRACGAPLPARDGRFVLKYLLLQKPSRRQR